MCACNGPRPLIWWFGAQWDLGREPSPEAVQPSGDLKSHPKLNKVKSRLRLLQMALQEVLQRVLQFNQASINFDTPNLGSQECFKGDGLEYGTHAVAVGKASWVLDTVPCSLLSCLGRDDSSQMRGCTIMYLHALACRTPGVFVGTNRIVRNNRSTYCKKREGRLSE